MIRMEFFPDTVRVAISTHWRFSTCIFQRAKAEKSWPNHFRSINGGKPPTTRKKKIDSRGPETSTRVESRRALRRDPPMNNGSRALSVANFIQSIGYGGAGTTDRSAAETAVSLCSSTRRRCTTELRDHCVRFSFLMIRGKGVDWAAGPGPGEQKKKGTQ